MARDLDLNIRGDARRARQALEDVATGSARAARVSDQLSRSFDHLEHEASQAQRQLDHLNDELSRNGPSAELSAELARVQNQLSDIANERGVAENLRAQFRRSTAAAAQLDHQLASTRRELDRLNDEYSRGGDPAVLRRIQEQQRELQRLNSTRRRIADEDENNQARLARLAEEARRAQERRDRDEENRSRSRLSRRIRNLGDSASGALDAVPARGGAIAAVGGAVAVPALAAVGGALTGIVGAGVAGAGVAGAIMGDPERFKAEWATAADSVKTSFLDATSIFTGPTLEAIRSIGPLVDSWHIDETFADAAKFVGPLVRGVEGFATGVIRGVSAMVNKGAPAVEALSSGLAELGNAAGDAFTSIADGAEGGGEALRDVLFFTADAIRLFGDLTGAAEDYYSFVHNHPVEAAFWSGGLSLGLTVLDQFSSATEQTGVVLDDTGRKGSAAGDAIADAWKGAEAAMAASAATADRLYDAQMGGVSAAVGWEQSIDDLTVSIKENGKNWDITTQKGRDNTTALQDSINAAKAVRDANIANGESVASANAKYEAQIGYLQGVATKAGLTKAQFDAMTAALLNYINTPQDKTITTKFVNFRYDYGVSQEGRIGSGEDPRGQTGKFYAKGGTVTDTGPMVVGERGAEVVWGNQGQYVSTAEQTRRLASAMSRGGPAGGGSVNLTVSAAPGGSGLDQAMQTWFMEALRTGKIQISSNGN